MNHIGCLREVLELRLENRAEIKYSTCRTRGPENMTTQPNTPIDERDDRPKALRYADRLDAIEEMIVDALPDITRKLIAMAKDGDLAAARYLYDRIGGRPAHLTQSPSIDRTLPYSRRDWTSDLIAHNDRRESSIAAFLRHQPSPISFADDQERAGRQKPRR